MPATLSRTGDLVREAARRDVRRSWTVLALTPVTGLASVLLSDWLFQLLGYSTDAGEAAPTGVAVAVGLPVVLLAAAPALLAYRYGLRALREGSREGIVPAMLGAAFAASFFTLNLFALVFGR